MKIQISNQDNDAGLLNMTLKGYELDRVIKTAQAFYLENTPAPNMLKQALRDILENLDGFHCPPPVALRYNDRNFSGTVTPTIARRIMILHQIKTARMRHDSNVLAALFQLPYFGQSNSTGGFTP